MPVNIKGKCVLSDEVLFKNMDAAILLGLPEIDRMHPAREGRIALIGSGPSVATQLDKILELRAAGVPLVAIKDAHDWLIEKGIVPDYAFAIDPQPHRFSCFMRKHADVHYMIASQCDPAMFAHLSGHKVTLWHPYIKHGCFYPPGKAVISGGTTSGLRALVVFYSLGWRDMALFGFDSCLSADTLRVNGTKLREHDSIVEIQIEPGGTKFYCNPAMAQQAQHFQEQYDFLPGVEFEAFGGGLIAAIIAKRREYIGELDLLRIAQNPNARVSFIHSGGPDAASYRYRASLPAGEIGASLNDLSADTLVFSKPQSHELIEMERCKARGGFVIVDFCDDHFDWMHYQEAYRLAHMITCPTEEMAKMLKKRGKQPMVIPDPFEYPEVAPHCNGVNLLWFGHHVNRHSLERVLPDLKEYPLMVVSNFDGAVPWSYENMLAAFKQADIVILPSTVDYKSNNRALEAIRQGCFVVAEDHPSLNNIPGIWVGKIKEGIEWARQNPQLARNMTSEAQRYVAEKYSPRTLASAWKKAIQWPTTSAAALSTGTNG